MIDVHLEFPGDTQAGQPTSYFFSIVKLTPLGPVRTSCDL